MWAGDGKFNIKHSLMTKNSQCNNLCFFLLVILSRTYNNSFTQSGEKDKMVITKNITINCAYITTSANQTVKLGT